jgi:hypothetical protein
MMHSNDKPEAYVHFSRTFARYVAVCHGLAHASQTLGLDGYACALIFGYFLLH